MPTDPRVIRLQRFGPLARLTFGPADPDLETLDAMGMPRPVPVELLGQVDSGAANSLVRYDVATRFGIIPSDRRPIRGIEMTSIQALGYYGHLAFEGGALVPCTVYEALPRSHPLGALIGRDVLQHAVWTYDGPSGTNRMKIKGVQVRFLDLAKDVGDA